MKVKIFHSSELYHDDAIQEGINDWLSDPKIIVQEVSQSECETIKTSPYIEIRKSLTISIWYDEGMAPI